MNSLGDRPLRIAVNATAYDAAPSGARNRTVNLCAALLRAGAHLHAFSSPRLDFGSLVAEEFGSPLPREAWLEGGTGLDPSYPLRRAILGPRWFRTHVTAQRYDLFLTDYYPVLKDVPTALSIHDLRDFARPSCGTLSWRRWARASLRYIWFRGFYPRTARRASLVLTLTTARRQESVRLLAVPVHRVVVVHPGVSRAFRAASAVRGEGSHLLAVGMADERKGARVLCAAQRRAAAKGNVLPLVMTGRSTPFITDVLAEYDDLVRDRLLRFDGIVTEARLIELYRQAAALLHASQYEGFGIPVLEAMTLGVPVVAASDPAVEEVAGSTASYIPAHDTSGWVRAIRRISDRKTAPPRPNRLGRERAAALGIDEAAHWLLTAARQQLGR